jgi:tetratricopeptide (TPR) repeat protein
MEVFLGIGIALLTIFSILIVRSLTTLFHELGHAVPALFFTSDTVKVFVGSHGDSDHPSLKLGRFQIFFKMSLFDWNIGMCESQRISNFWKRFFIIIGGPIASLLVAIPFYFLLMNDDFPYYLRFMIFVFLIAAVIDFFINIIPINRSFRTHKGDMIYNDGYNLIALLTRKDLSKEFLSIEQKYVQGKYEEVIIDCNEMIADGKESKQVYYLLASSYQKEGDYEEALSRYTDMNNKYKLSHEDYYDLGVLYNEKRDYKRSIESLDHYLYINFSDARALELRGKSKLFIDDFEGALKDLERAISLDKKIVSAWSYRFGALVKLGNLEAAEKALEQAKKIDPDNPLMTYYQGVYHYDSKDYDNALKYLSLAEKNNLPFHDIQYKLSEVIRYINFQKE